MSLEKNDHQQEIETHDLPATQQELLKFIKFLKGDKVAQKGLEIITSNKHATITHAFYKIPEIVGNQPAPIIKQFDKLLVAAINEVEGEISQKKIEGVLSTQTIKDLSSIKQIISFAEECWFKGLLPHDSFVKLKDRFTHIGENLNIVDALNQLIVRFSKYLNSISDMKRLETLSRNSKAELIELVEQKFPAYFISSQISQAAKQVTKT